MELDMDFDEDDVPDVPSGRRQMGFGATNAIHIGPNKLVPALTPYEKLQAKQRLRNQKYCKAKRLYYRAFGRLNNFEEFMKNHASDAIGNDGGLDMAIESLTSYIQTAFHSNRRGLGF